MKTALRAVLVEAREGYHWPRRFRHLTSTPTTAERLIRAARWASYEAREHLAVWIDPGP